MICAIILWNCLNFHNFDRIISLLKKNGDELSFYLNKSTNIVVFNTEKKSIYYRYKMDLFKLKVFYIKAKGVNIEITDLNEISNELS